jgi:hypothetical protein
VNSVPVLQIAKQASVCSKQASFSLIHELITLMNSNLTVRTATAFAPTSRSEWVSQVNGTVVFGWFSIQRAC